LKPIGVLANDRGRLKRLRDVNVVARKTGQDAACEARPNCQNVTALERDPPARPAALVEIAISAERS
jgi:hypothetical protein